jgi:alpha-D-xyloside xylohydrolase
MLQLHNLDKRKIRNLKTNEAQDCVCFSYDCDATSAYGMGERFDGVDRMDKRTECTIIEKFTNQGDKTYFPLPFFFCNDGHGLFVETDAAATFTLTKGHVDVSLPAGEYDAHFFYGSPKEIVSQFAKMTGAPALPPKWAFGPWISANRWNKQSDVEEQMEILRKTGYPATALVIEAWSDEATFYIWNGATYETKDGGATFTESDLAFKEPWPNPKGMIDALHAQNVKLVLWQIPALKKLDEGQACPQHDADDDYAVSNGLVVQNADGTPYRIPKQWFIGAHVPDFSFTKTRKWWMEKRRYLTDMGVDGFKTDGGEFIHDLSVRFHNGRDGVSMRNRYVADYEETYTDALNAEQTLFSRAGYLGAQKCPIHWAGDQVSTFSEMRAVLGAGLSLGLSGVPFWSFDIGGFAGALPSAELYLRSTALSVFAPVMQWHSEPLGGQFGGFETGLVNDRSPWNMAKHTDDPDVQRIALLYAHLRMNLLPELYRQARISVEANLPMMRHLVLEYPTDENAQSCHDQFMLGDLLIAPVLEEGATSRGVYLPQGRWYGFLTKEILEGGCTVEAQADRGQIPVYLRTPGVVALNLPDSMRVGGDVGNRVDTLQNLVLVASGKPNCDYQDEFGNDAVIKDGEICSGNVRVIDVKNLTFEEGF